MKRVVKYYSKLDKDFKKVFSRANSKYVLEKVSYSHNGVKTMGILFEMDDTEYLIVMDVKHYDDVELDDEEIEDFDEE